MIKDTRKAKSNLCRLTGLICAEEQLRDRGHRFSKTPSVRGLGLIWNDWGLRKQKEKDV